MVTTITLERQHAHVVAEEYRRKGYEVIEEPSPGQLPDFLSGYRPDLLVCKGNEALAVEVKTRSSLRKDSQVRELIQLLREKPGWKFELIVVHEQDKLDLPQSARPMLRDDILQRVEEAERLLEWECFEVALLSACSASDATIRLLIEKEGISPDHFTSHYILDQAVINGVISRSDYNSLTNTMKFWNALAHGFKSTDFDSAVVERVIRITQRLLRSAVTSQSGPRTADQHDN